MNEHLFLNGLPVGSGEVGTVVAPVAVATEASPWTVALVTSAIGTATSWVLEEVVRSARKRRRR